MNIVLQIIRSGLSNIYRYNNVNISQFWNSDSLKISPLITYIIYYMCDIPMTGTIRNSNIMYILHIGYTV